jgi:sec-independent protein translocase protein TatC
MALFKKNNVDTDEMSFMDHLEAFRGHLVRSVIVILIFVVIFFVYRNWIFDNIIAGPLNSDFIGYRAFCKLSEWLHLGKALCMEPVEVKMQSNTFGGQLFSTLTMCFIGGIILAFPYIFWEFWQFVKPALKEKERKNVRFATFWVSFFFFLGVLFGFIVLAPFTFNFLASFQLGTQGLIENKPTITDYFDNLMNLSLGCGIAFEMPVLAWVLTKIGLVTPKLLKAGLRYAIVIILVVAAVITPSPDISSQMIVFIPLFSLYLFSILVSNAVYKKDLKEAEEWS